MRRNHRRQQLADGSRFAVDNGRRGQLTHFDAVGAHVMLTGGEEVVLDRGYLAAGWLDYGYASTVHTAQGVTCDHVLVVGPTGLYREAVYVAMSRARLSAWIYGTTTEALGLADRHATGIPLPGERVPDAEHELVERIHVSGAKQLVSTRDTEAACISDLATEVPVATLLARARQAHHAERLAERDGHTDPTELQAELDRAVAFRAHADVGRRVRALDRDNVGHVVALADAAATCDVVFVNEQGGTATRTLAWSELVLIDQPEATVLTEEHLATLERLTDDVDRAARRWASALASHGVEPGDTDRFQRAAQVACDRASHRLRADPPDWLTSWLGRRPSDGPGAAVWDDAVARIARHRAVHDIDEATPGLGPRPPDPEASEAWQDAMLRTLRARVWLTDHQHEPQASHPTMSPAAMHERRAALQALMNTAPADHRELIALLTADSVDPAEVHEHLVVAVNAQQERREWIIANWPHVVELEQLNELIAAQPARAHWPTTNPPAVQVVLDALAKTAPLPSSREDRTLATLDQEAATNDPVRQAEAKIRGLAELAERASTHAERTAVEEAVRAARLELRQARREQRIDDVFARYGSTPHDDAVERRMHTIAYDTLTNPPDWIVEHLHELHDSGQLGTLRVDELGTRIVEAATHLDRIGHLPRGWTAIGPERTPCPVPVVEIDAPGL